ncbi:MAG: matrixin family metalloprotease [Bryobacteraceae bacterium]
MRLLALMLLAAGVGPAETFTYWIQPCGKEPEAECQSLDERLAQWAMEDWERASGGGLSLKRGPLGSARIRLYWASSRHPGLYGEARGIEVGGQRGAEIHIRPSLKALGEAVESLGDKDPLFRHAIIYLTCLHEIGHALGMPHTRSFADIMYSFEHGGDILEYFQRYRRKLESIDDIRQVSGVSQQEALRLLGMYKAKAVVR